MRLTIITPCSRPENLDRMRPSIEAGRSVFDIDWLVIFDTGKVELKAVEGAQVNGVLDFNSNYGNAQRNLGIQMTDAGWVYFLDDDNLIHPDFFTALHEAITQHKGVLAWAFNQGKRQARPENMKVNRVDMAQVCIDRALIDTTRFSVYPYNADGLFIQELYESAPQLWGFIDRELAYYNALRTD